jgi:hypothetical protein
MEISSGGYQCSGCGGWVSEGTGHTCPTLQTHDSYFINLQPTEQQILTELQAIRESIERLVELVIEIEKRG